MGSSDNYKGDLVELFIGPELYVIKDVGYVLWLGEADIVVNDVLVYDFGFVEFCDPGKVEVRRCGWKASKLDFSIL